MTRIITAILILLICSIVLFGCASSSLEEMRAKDTEYQQAVFQANCEAYPEAFCKPIQ